jgi:hypothetical protein
VAVSHSASHNSAAEECFDHSGLEAPEGFQDAAMLPHAPYPRKRKSKNAKPGRAPPHNYHLDIILFELNRFAVVMGGSSVR